MGRGELGGKAEKQDRREGSGEKHACFSAFFDFKKRLGALFIQRKKQDFIIRQLAS
jgi:hypothetical protein